MLEKKGFKLLGNIHRGIIAPKTQKRAMLFTQGGSVSQKLLENVLNTCSRFVVYAQIKREQSSTNMVQYV